MLLSEMLVASSCVDSSKQEPFQAMSSSSSAKPECAVPHLLGAVTVWEHQVSRDGKWHAVSSEIPFSSDELRHFPLPALPRSVPTTPCGANAGEAKKSKSVFDGLKSSDLTSPNNAVSMAAVLADSLVRTHGVGTYT